MKGRLMIDLARLARGGAVVFRASFRRRFSTCRKATPRRWGRLEYDVWAQRFGSELLLTGTLSAPFEFTCVRTLHPFVQTIRLEGAAVSIEIGNEGEIDATEALREEILINFPVDPRCEEGDVPQKCEIDPRYLSVDKPAEDELPTPPRAEGDDRWSALDNLKDLKDQP